MKKMFGNIYNKSFYILLLASVFSAKISFSQKVIRLNNVLKFELVTRGGGLSGNYRKLDVVPDGTGWKSYQTDINESTMKGIINDSAKIFIKNISPDILDHLLEIIAKQDTGINIDLFQIDPHELTSAVFDQSPPPKKYIKAIQSKAVIQKTLENVLTPFIMDDRSYYGITIITKTNLRFTIKAYSFAYLYNLPWEINKTKSYDPNISLIFEFISGNDNYPIYEKKRLYLTMGRYLSKVY